jgi:hypothetical protein
MQSMCHIDCDHDPLIKVLNPFKPRRRRRDVRFFRAIDQRSIRRIIERAPRKSRAATACRFRARPMLEVWRGSLQHDTVNFPATDSSFDRDPDLTE